MRLLSRSARAAFAVATLLALPLAAAAPVASATGTGGPNPAAAVVAAHVPTAPGGGGGGGVASSEVSTASTLTVTTTADDGSPGSLRDVIENQATSVGGDTVVLAAGATYVLTCSGGGTITHGDTPLEIQGNGATITMEVSGCEQGILVNGDGALVIRDVQFAGLRLEPTTRITAIVKTDGPLALVGGRVADNVVDAGAQAFDAFFYVTGNAPDAGLLVDGTGFVANDRTDASDCALFCVVGDVELRNASFTDTTVETGGGCGAVLCVTGDVDVIDTTITASVSSGTSHCGGIVCIAGGLRFTRSTITGTVSVVTAPGSLCGGIVCTSGGVLLTDSAVLGTVADGPAEDQCGAGVACGGGDVDLVRSTVSGTRVTLAGSGGGNGCGSMVCMQGALTAVNSTVADNTTTGGADLVGAWTTSEAIGLVYVTFVGNSGSGIPALAPSAADEITFTTFGSVLTGSGSGGTCATGLSVTSTGYDFGDDQTCGLTGPGDVDQPGGNPGLGPLADNGGPGPTMLPAGSSPLVDAVPAAACAAGRGITVDERSLPRPSSQGASCDVGAVELQPPAVPQEPTFTG